LTLPSDASMPAKPLFVPIIAEPTVSKAAEAGVPTPKLSPRSDTPVIEVRLAGAVVRIGVGADCKLLAEVLRAVRASAT
jgi:hypothetical protein